MDIKTEKYWLMEGNCLDRMKEIPDHSVDMILCDLPYGATDCEWDSVIPFDRLWEQYQRVLKPYGNCLLFGTQPFISDVINSNKREFSHVWYWIKNNVTGALNARRQPLRCIEEVAVFVCNIPSKTFGEGYSKAREYLREQKRLSGLSSQQLRDLLGTNMAGHCFTNGKQFAFPSADAYRKLQSTGFFQMPLDELRVLDGPMTKAEERKAVYNPQGVRELRKEKVKRNYRKYIWGETKSDTYIQKMTGYPKHILRFDTDVTRLHPTQKPVDMLAYLIRTYSDDDAVVLDNCMGSGSTGAACAKTGRRFIGIEMNPHYFEVSRSRIEKENESS